jgi:hypothetical protein
MSNWTVTIFPHPFVVTDENTWVGADLSYGDGGMEVTEIAPPPEVPPPVWDQRPIDGARAMAAVRSMSRGGA